MKSNTWRQGENVSQNCYNIFENANDREALKDYPSEDEFGPDKTFPHLLPQNFARGINQTYMNPVDDNGVPLSERLRLERQAKAQKLQDQQLQKHIDDLFEIKGPESLKSFDLGPNHRMKPTANNTLAKKAASALAVSNKDRKLANSAIASKAQKPSALNVRKSRLPGAPPSNSSPTRFAAANAASRSTLGYAQGRAISQKVRKPVTSVFRDNNTAKNARSISAVAPKSPSEEEFMGLAQDVVAQLRMQDLAAVEDGEDAELMGRAPIFVEDDDDFQLLIPNGDD